MLILKNIGALLAGFAVVVFLSMGTDTLLEKTGVLPPFSEQGLYITWMLALALFYRTVYTIVGGYVTALLAPEKPRRLVSILGILGTVAGIGGVIAGWNLSAHWYPIALAVLAFPSVYAGGKIYERTARGAQTASVQSEKAAISPTGAQEITITKIFDAGRQRVWEMWTKPEKFAQWFGVPPLAATVETTKMDLRVGGRWQADMVNAEDGTRMPFGGTYLEIDSPRKLVFTMEDPTNPANPNKETVTVTFRDRMGTTDMTMHQVGHLPPEEYGAPLQNGYNAFFDRMTKYLASHN